MARYTHTMNGAFEVYKDSTGNHVLRQQLDKTAYGVGEAWNSGDPTTLIGDFRWMNYAVSVDVLFETERNTPYAAVAIRQTGSSHKITNSSGYSFRVSPTGSWILYRKQAKIASGQLGKIHTSGKGRNSGILLS